MKQNKFTITPLYMFIGVLFTVCMLISNIIAGKMIAIGPWSLTAGVMVFPITYIIGDVVAEVYGFKASRRLMWIAFGMNLLMVIFFALTIAIPAPVWFDATAYATVLGNTPRLLIAGLSAYVFGSWVNMTVLSKMKVKTQGKGFGARAIISTILGELVDSLIFVPIGFLGKMPVKELIVMGLLQVTFKTTYEIIILPLTSFVVKKVKAYENIDVYDVDETYRIIGGK